MLTHAIHEFDNPWKCPTFCGLSVDQSFSVATVPDRVTCPACRDAPSFQTLLHQQASRWLQMSVLELQAEHAVSHNTFLGAALAWENGPHDYIAQRVAMAPVFAGTDKKD